MGEDRAVHGRPSFVFFDAGNTLITSHFRIDTIYASTFRKYGADLPEGDAARAVLGPRISDVWRAAQEALREGEDRYSLPGGERAFWRRFVDEIADRAELTFDRQGAFEELYEYYTRAEAWDVYEDVRPTLVSLAAAKVRMGVISNWDRRLPTLLDTLGLASYFDPIVVSAIEQVEKPSPELYTRAAARAGVDPARCLHIGDSEPLDIEGGRAAGMEALLVVRGRAGKLASATDAPRARSTDAETIKDLRTLVARFV